MRRVEDFVESHPRATLATLLALYFVVSVLRAAPLRFWFDELYTIHLARIALVGDLRRALLDGADQQTILFDLVMRPFAGASRWELMVARLPSIFGFGAMLAGLWTYARKPFGVMGAAMAFVFPCLTRAVDYSTEARAYAMVLGCAAWSLVCWRECREQGRRTSWLVGLWLTLALAISFNYYGVLLLIPLSLGELHAAYARRKLDWPVAVAILGSLVALLPLMPFVQSARQFGGHHWSHPAWPQWSVFYSGLFHKWTLVCAAASFVLHVAARGTRPSSGTQSISTTLAPAVGYAALPLVALAMGVLVTGAYTERYAEPALIGFALVAVVLFDRAAPNARTPILILCACAALIAPIWTAGQRARNFDAPPARFGDQRAIEALAAQTQESVVVGDALVFLELQYYASPTMRQKFFYVADAELSLVASGTDTIDRGLLAMSKYVELPVQSPRRFFAEHSTFLIVGEGTASVAAERYGYRAEVVERGTPSLRVLRAISRSNSSP